MAQKVVGYVRFQVPAGKATPAPPVGPALGQYGVNIGQFTKDFNERTKGDMGMMIPVVITVYSDRSFTFITKTPPAALLIKKACGIETASGVPQRDKVATISKEDVRKIAETKMPDLNAASIEADDLSQLLSVITKAVTFFGALAMMLWYSPLMTAIAAGVTVLPLIASLLTGGQLQAAENRRF